MSAAPENTPILTLVDALRAAAAAAGDARGYTFYTSPSDSSVLGYASLDARARAIAVALRARGLVEGDAIMLAVAPGLAFIETLFGALYAGLIFVPVPMAGIGSPDATARLAGLARVAGARAVLAEDPAVGDAGIPVHLVAELATGDATSWERPAVDPGAVAALLFTSGSTGDPKGVIVTHGSVVAACRAMADLFGLGADSVYAGWAPLHHAMGLAFQTLVPAYLGIDAAIATTAVFQRRPLFWLQMLSAHRATFTVAGNFAFDLCTQLATDEQIAALDLSSVATFVTGSEPVRTDTVQRFVERFAPAGVHPDAVTPAFGSTEGMLLTSKPAGEPLVIRDFDVDALETGVLTSAEGDRAIEMVSCGRVTDGFAVRAVDPATGVPVADGKVGELWFAGPSVSPGYWRNPEATAEVFGMRIDGDGHPDPGAYYRSGDLGAVIDGEVFITGRLKDLIIIRGRNVYPQDIEAAASRAHAGVGVTAAFELTGHAAPVGIVVEYDPETVAETELETLAAELRDGLAAQFSLPAVGVAVVAPGGVPRTASGKVRRAAARAALDAGELPVVHTSGLAAV